MRAVKTIPDVQRALNELYLLYDSLKGKNLDLNGRKVQNASPAARKGEYVTFEQLPVFKQEPVRHKDQFYTVVWEFDNTVEDDEFSPSFIVGNGREGTPHQVWVTAEGSPDSDDLSINIEYTYYDVISGDENETVIDAILKDDLVFPQDATKRVWSSSFITPVPAMGNMAKLRSHIVVAGGASIVSIGLVIKRKMGSS